MGKMPGKKKWILSVVSVTLSLMVTGCSFNFGRNNSPAFSWEDYSIDVSDLAVSIEADQEDSIDCITLYGVGDLNVEFPCSTVADLNKEGDTVYDWSVIIDNFKVSLLYNYTYIGFSKKNNGSIAPKDMRAAIILKDGSEAGDIKFEVKDNAICFYDVTLPGKTDCLQGVSNVKAEVNIANNHFISEDLPVCINGKVGKNADTEDDYDTLLADLGIVQVADNKDSNEDSNLSGNDEDKEGSDNSNENNNDNSSSESDNSSSETVSGKEFEPGQLFSPNGWNISCIYGKFQATPQTDFDKEFFESDGAATVEIKRDGTYTLTCLSGGDEWTCSGKVTVVDKENEMDDIVVYLHDAVNSSGQKVKAKFVFTDAEDYPIFETEGFGYMGGNGAPYWFERVQ